MFIQTKKGVVVVVVVGVVWRTGAYMSGRIWWCGQAAGSGGMGKTRW